MSFTELGFHAFDAFFVGIPVYLLVVAIFRIRPFWLMLLPAILYLPFQLLFATMPSLYYLLAMGAPNRLDVNGETLVWNAGRLKELNALLYMFTMLPLHFVWPAILSYAVFRRAEAGWQKRIALCLTIYWTLCVVPGWVLFAMVNDFID